jgi:hypothetical protein
MMPITRRHLMLVVLIASPAPVWAEQPQTRSGFWLSVGAGVGSAQVDCDQCSAGNRVGSFSGTFRLGGTLGQHWLLGWEGNGWLKNNATEWLPAYAGADRTLGGSFIVALYYPVASSGFFLKAGSGVSWSGFSYGDCVDDSCYVQDAASGVGLGFTAGLGYDVRIGRNKSLTPELTLAVGLPRDMTEGGRNVATGWKFDIVAINLCFTFH